MLAGAGVGNAAVAVWSNAEIEAEAEVDDVGVVLASMKVSLRVTGGAAPSTNTVAASADMPTLAGVGARGWNGCSAPLVLIMMPESESESMYSPRSELTIA